MHQAHKAIISTRFRINYTHSSLLFSIIPNQTSPLFRAPNFSPSFSQPYSFLSSNANYSPSLQASFIHSFILSLSLLPFLPQSSLPHHKNVPPHITTPSSPALKRMDPIELKRVFQMFDRNGDGRITRKELNDSLESLGIFIPDKDLRQMIQNIDINGDGCVDIEEFGELYQSIMEERNEEEDMREAFDVFDQNGDGFITVDELRSVLSSLGLKQGRAMEDCKKMIMKVDVDGDGRVNYNEFKQMMKGGGFGALS